MNERTLNNPAGSEEILFEIGKEGVQGKTQRFDEDLYIEVTGNFFVDTYRRLDDWLNQ